MLEKISHKDLQLVRLIAEDGSLTSAARRMHVSQPAASQRLANLQARVAAAVPFFDSNPRRNDLDRLLGVGSGLAVPADRLFRQVVSRRLILAPPEKVSFLRVVKAEAGERVGLG